VRLLEVTDLLNTGWVKGHAMLPGPAKRAPGHQCADPKERSAQPQAIPRSARPKTDESRSNFILPSVKYKMGIIT